jgi:hypothetical protein
LAEGSRPGSKYHRMTDMAEAVITTLLADSF